MFLDSSNSFSKLCKFIPFLYGVQYMVSRSWIIIFLDADLSLKSKNQVKWLQLLVLQKHAILSTSASWKKSLIFYDKHTELSLWWRLLNNPNIYEKVRQPIRNIYEKVRQPKINEKVRQPKYLWKSKTTHSKYLWKSKTTHSKYLWKSKTTQIFMKK